MFAEKTQVLSELYPFQSTIPFVTKTDQQQWTTKSLLAWMTQHFEEHNIDSPRLISEMLLTHILGGQRIDLYANANRLATDAERETLRKFVQRALEHEPVQYIVGESWFFGMEFAVNNATLIPRSCTETIVEQALLHCKNSSERTPRIADIGTGSGCIAIAIAANCAHCHVTATDISRDALALASKNAHRHHVSNQIEFVEGDGTAPLTSLETYDIICANPPYIPDHEMETLAPNVSKWEPTLALSGGVDGLEIIKPIIETCPALLGTNGVLLLEIATSIRDKVLEIANDSPSLEGATILRDAHGDDRFLRAMKPSQ